jgi:hypothetical protein
MADWSKNHIAQFETWNFFSRNKQTKVAFDKAETLKVESLKFFNLAASADARSVLAGALASAMDNYFRRKPIEAGYEKDRSWGNVIPELAAVLTDGKRTLGDLAKVVDEAYDFAGEPEDNVEV